MPLFQRHKLLPIRPSDFCLKTTFPLDHGVSCKFDAALKTGFAKVGFVTEGRAEEACFVTEVCTGEVGPLTKGRAGGVVQNWLVLGNTDNRNPAAG